MFGNLTLPLIGTILIYFVVLILRNVHLNFPHRSTSGVKIGGEASEVRHVDISDSRLSNFDSNSTSRVISSEELVVDRVIPLTSMLNKLMNRVLKRFSLNIQLEEKVMITLKDDFVNSTYKETRNGTETKRGVYGMNGVVTRLDSIQPLGNAYISEDSDQMLVLTQRLRFQILKCTYDYCDSNMTFIGSSSLICSKNTFILSVTMSTNFDNSKCKVENIKVSFVPVDKCCYLKVDGLFVSSEFNEKLRSAQLDNFLTKVVPSIKQEIEPLLAKAIHKENICSYFDANDGNIK